MDNLLEKEKFNSIKELKDVQQSISDARVALEKLQTQTADAEKHAEFRLTKRTEAVINSLKQTFVKIDEDMDVLKSFKNELISFSENILKLSDIVEKQKDGFIEFVEKQDAYLSGKLRDLEIFKDDLEIENRNIRKSREDIKREMAKISDEERKVKDKRDAFERAWGELEEKKKDFEKKSKKVK